MVILWTMNDFFVLFNSTYHNRTGPMTGVARWYGKAGNEWLTFSLISSAEMNRNDTTCVFKVNE